MCATTSQKCEAVPKRSRIQGSYTFASLNARLESNKEEKNFDGTAWLREERSFEEVAEMARARTYFYYIYFYIYIKYLSIYI